MSSPQAFRHVILPIGLRIAIPSTANTASSVIKDTSYLSAIAFAELTYVATSAIATTYRVFEFFTVLAVSYLTIVLLFTFALHKVDACLGLRGSVAVS